MVLWTWVEKITCSKKLTEMRNGEVLARSVSKNCVDLKYLGIKMREYYCCADACKWPLCVCVRQECEVRCCDSCVELKNNSKHMEAKEVLSLYAQCCKTSCQSGQLFPFFPSCFLCLAYSKIKHQELEYHTKIGMKRGNSYQKNEEISRWEAGTNKHTET